mgnify:CR=1 FL=1
MPRPKDMPDALALAKQIIGDDTAVAAPPDGFRAHGCAAVLDAEFSAQTRPCANNMSMVRHLALNLIRAMFGKHSINGKRKNRHMVSEYRVTALQAR